MIAAFEFFAACVGVLCIAFFIEAPFVWLVFDRSMREFTAANQPTQSISLWYWLVCCFVAVLLGSLRAVHSLKKSRARAARQAALVEERLSAVRSLKQRSGLAKNDETG